MSGNWHERLRSLPVIGFLCLCGSLQSQTERVMFGNLFIKKPEKVTIVKSPSRKRDAFDIHLDLTFKIQSEYKKRNIDSRAIDRTIQLCLDQISISLEAREAWLAENQEIGVREEIMPGHKGYEQLCIIYEKQGLFIDAINLAQRAKAEKWKGDWKDRISRMKKKLLKLKK